MERPIQTPLPADLPENWRTNQIVSPDGVSVGLDEKHGYNYQAGQVNAAQRGVNALNEAFDGVAASTHASQHSAGGSDPVTPAAIGAATIAELAGKADAAAVEAALSNKVPFYDKYWQEIVASEISETCYTRATFSDHPPGLPDGQGVVFTEIYGDGFRRQEFFSPHSNSQYERVSRTALISYSGWAPIPTAEDLAGKVSWSGDIITGSALTWAEAQTTPTGCGTRPDVTDTPYSDYWMLDISLYQWNNWRILRAVNVVNGDEWTNIMNTGVWGGWHRIATAADIAAITPAGIGAATDSHGHDLNTLSGTLPVSKGGTGQTTLAGLVSALVGNGVARIQRGSYNGTGTFGYSNPNRLSFNFAPKLLFIINTSSSGEHMFWCIDCMLGGVAIKVQTNGATTGVEGDGIRVGAASTSISWYSANSAKYQGNTTYSPYFYIAIG